MIRHYLKVAVRNLWKYKTQHLISLAGVGVALLCFSICLYLVRYVYDLDHCFENYDRIAELSLYEEANEKGGDVYTCHSCRGTASEEAGRD